MSSPRKSKLGTMCSAVGCSMRSGTNLLSAVKMYRFPTNPSRRLHCKEKNWKANPKSALCNKHFITGKPSSDAEHPDYVPSIFASMKNKGSSSSVNRYNRQVKRREVWNAPLTGMFKFC
ncbi:THAP-type domain-containing protein [Trichonephila clavipes]|nr:THAP-type domain-containing protein [Trichonephila clavipes]